MKIAYLLGSLNRGGTETLLLDVFRNAVRSKLDAIGVYRKGGVLEEEFIQSGVTMYKLKVGKNLLSYLIKLRKLIINNDIRIVHAQQPIDALYALLACTGKKTKIILTFHGYDFNDKVRDRLIVKFVIKHTDRNIFVSESLGNYYIQKYKLNPATQQVVYNGISFDKLNTLTHQISNVRNELEISSETLLLGTVGNFVNGRDQQTLCRFLKLLNQEKVDFHFIFVGKKADNMPQLFDNCVNYCSQNGLSERVTFLGSRSNVPEILYQLDAFVYATNHDSFGIAVVEAMATGIPVFVNDWEVMNEITNKGEQAIVYKTRDEADLLQHFMLFLHDKQFYQTKAKEAAIFVRENYSIEKHIQNLKIIYKTVSD